VHNDNLAYRELRFPRRANGKGDVDADRPADIGGNVDPSPPGDTTIVAYERLRSQVETLRSAFATARPFPHLVLEDFLAPAAAQSALAAFPARNEDWTHYFHYNERTFGMNDRSKLPEAAAKILNELNSNAFVSLLEEFTGIARLRADPSLEGGGLHKSERGGYLNLHADFTVHPHRPDWRRRLNLLVFLNPDWDDSWGGQIEFWDARVQRCEQRIAPRYNRAVLFRTDERSFHGYPDPLCCPDGVIRKSLALYYFTEEVGRPRAVSTEYRGRPGDGPRCALIFLDTLALRLYDRCKRVFGFDDRFASRLLRSLSRRRRGR
jgi:hypothetical protein